VMRVLSRILSIWEDIAKPSTRKIFEKAVRELISHDDPSAFNQALMELGALICTPTSPSCLLCPVRDHCQGFHEGVESELPIKSKKNSQKSVDLAAVVVKDEKGRILIHKRPETGLLANLWEFPNVEMHQPVLMDRSQITDLFNESFDMNIKLEKSIGQIEHIFSHLIWNIRVYIGTINSNFPEGTEWKFLTLQEMEEYAFPVSFHKILKLYKENA
jgi:A/G-specific adenine glycosylase